MNTPAWRISLAALLLSISAAALANLGSDDSPAPNDPNFVAGRRAIDALDWPGAVAAMQKAVAADPKNSDAYNWLGYAQRKQGKFDAALAAYREALRLDPRNRSAHEYIGEAYLALNQPAKAEEHLAELTRICTPLPCEEMKDLRRAIDEYKKNAK